MSAPHRLLADLDALYRSRIADVRDPGTGGTLTIENNALAICRVTTEAAEARTLEDANNFAVGQRLLVILESDGGDLTLNSDDTPVVLTTASQFAEFVVTSDGTNNVWRSTSVDLPASAGTYEFLNTASAADNRAGLLAILDALQAAGLIDRSGITVA